MLPSHGIHCYNIAMRLLNHRSYSFDTQPVTLVSSLLLTYREASSASGGSCLGAKCILFAANVLPVRDNINRRWATLLSKGKSFRGISLIIPDAILFNLLDQTQCWIDLGSPWAWKLYMSLVSAALFVFPALIISACYAIIVRTIWAKGAILGHSGEFITYSAHPEAYTGNHSVDEMVTNPPNATRIRDNEKHSKGKLNNNKTLVFSWPRQRTFSSWNLSP